MAKRVISRPKSWRVRIFAELPAQTLLIGLSVLGVPLVGIDGVTVNVDTSGPSWLFDSVGSV